VDIRVVLEIWCCCCCFKNWELLLFLKMVLLLF